MLLLKIFGFVLLAIIGIVLFLLLLVLLVPFRYSGKVKTDGNSTGITLKITFLLRFVSFSLAYAEKKLTKSGRIGFIPMKSDGKETKKEAERKEKDEKEDSSEEENAENKKKLTFWKRIRNVFRNREYIKKLWNREKDTIFSALGKVKSEIKRILPRKMNGYVEFGFDDPSTTGEVLGVISVVYAMGFQMIDITPDFSEKKIDANVEAVGKITLFTIALTLLLLYSNKELRKTLHKFKRYTEITPEDRKNV